MEEALRGKLLGTAAVTAAVGNRIDWGVRSQGSLLPAIVLLQVSGVPQMNLAAPSGWSRDRVQIEVWGRTFSAAKNIANAIGGDGGALVGFRGQLSGLRIRTFVVGRRNDSDNDEAGPVHRTALDVIVWHSPLPTGATP